MTYKRRDRNHTEIIKTLRKLGAKVFDTADLGHGFVDAIASIHGRLWLIEIKDGSKPPSQQKLTATETEFHRQWAPHVVIINSIEAAINFVKKELVDARVTMP